MTSARAREEPGIGGQSHPSGVNADMDDRNWHPITSRARRAFSNLVDAARQLPLRPTIGLLLLSLATILQIRLLTRSFIWPKANRYREVWAYTAWERSAVLSEGEDFLEFVSFLREVIPESAKVVFPPHSYVARAGTFTELGFMQYFMFPRRVLNCGEPVDDCVRTLTGPNSYLVEVGGFPPPLVAQEVKDHVPFNERRGVYVPR